MKRYSPILASLVIAILFLTMWVTPASAQTPVLTCNPASGYLNTSITLTGSGFPTGFGSEAEITVTWDGAPLSVYPTPLFVDNNGGFTAYCSPPFNAAFGNHIIRASGDFGEGGEEAAQTTFRLIAPSLEASPTSGFSTVTLVGRGFYPQGEGQEINLAITWDNTPIPIMTLPSSYYGYGNDVYVGIISVYTQTTPGSHTLKATQELDGRTMTAQATFTVTDMKGAAGAKGDTGAAGAKGATGPQGFNGAQGSAGGHGAAGAQGPAGAPGAQGPPGAQGSSGSQGQPGPQGPGGPPGAAGPAGPAGAEGPEGQPGAAGTGTTLGIVALVVAAGTLVLFVLAKMKKWIFG